MIGKKSIGVLTLLKLIGAVLGVIYSVIQVQYFGTSRDIEIYFAATALTAIMFSLSQSGVLAEIFLPIYHKLKTEKGKEVAQEAFSVVISRISLGVIFICTLAYLFAPFLIRITVPGFEEAAQQEVISVFRVMCFLLFPQIISSFFVIILNAEKIFGRTEFIGLFRITLNLLVLVLTYEFLGLWSLVISLCVGQVLTFIIYLKLLSQGGIRLAPVLYSKEFDHTSFFKSIYSTLLYVGGTQFYNIILNSSISILPQGYYAVFKYVQTLYTKTRGVITQPLLIVFFTNFSIALNRKADSLEKIVKEYLSFAFFTVCVVLLLTVSFGDFFIKILWGGDKFGKEFIFPAYEILVFNFFGLLITSVGNIFRKIAIATNQSRQAYTGWAISQIITGIIVYLLLASIKEDGLKYIFPINVLLLSSVSWILVARKNWSLARAFNWSNIVKITLLTGALIPLGLFFGNFFHSLNWVQNERISLLISTIIFSLILISIFFILGFILKIPEMIWSVLQIKKLNKKFN